MRIISGSAKGKKLHSPLDERIRPTSDRAREGLFSVLESEYGNFRDLCVLDLFAGTGAVGVEALSRGASLVHAVEKDFTDLTRSNFSLVDLADGRFQIFHAKANDFLENCEAIRYDIIFMDPPYEMSNAEITELLIQIRDRQLIQPRGIIAIERASKEDAFVWPDTMACEKVRSYGEASIYFGGYLLAFDL